MIAYNETWLANARLHAELEKEAARGAITAAELKAINEKYPVGFYTPNLFVRVGLFILTCIIIGFADAFLSLVGLSFNTNMISGWVFFLAILTYIALELMVKNKHYRSGVDDALLVIAGGQAIAALAIILYGHNGFYLTLSAVAFILFVFLSARFTDMLISATCCISLFAFVYFGCDKIGSLGLTVVPFIMMLASGFVYWMITVCTNKKELINYKNCFVVVQIVCLLTLYAAGNYYIIQTLSEMLTSQVKPVAFGPFFWAWTILVPFIYIGFGIRKKNVTLLRTGLLLIVAAAGTFRTYFHVLPIDISLTIVGAILLAIVYGVMKYLKTPKHGFTHKESSEVNLIDNLRIESLLVAKTFSHSPSAPTEGKTFGGGDFGGGGSSSDF